MSLEIMSRDIIESGDAYHPSLLTVLREHIQSLKSPRVIRKGHLPSPAKNFKARGIYGRKRVGKTLYIELSFEDWTTYFVEGKPLSRWHIYNWLS